LVCWGSIGIRCSGVVELDEALRAGISVDEDDGNLRSALFFAIQKHRLENIKFLLEHKADVRHKDNQFMTPLTYAAKLDDADAVRELLKYDVDVSIRTKSGSSALHEAAGNGNVGILKSILEKMEEKMVSSWMSMEKDEVGSPLHFAAGSQKNAAECCLILLDGGFNVNVVDSIGITPLHYASGRGDYALVKLLVERGANVNVRLQGGVTPLHMATDTGSIQCVHSLVDASAKLFKDHDNMSPLDIAKKRKEAGDRIGSILEGILENVPEGEETSEEITKRIGPIVDKYRLAGNRAYSIKSFDEAVNLFSMGLEMDSRNHILLSNRAAAYICLHQFEKAEADARFSLECEKRFVRGYYRLAVALNYQAKFEEASEIIAAGLQIDEKNKELLGLQSQIKDRKDAKEAKEATE
jgi:ankyrin repeat protein